MSYRLDRRQGGRQSYPSPSSSLSLTACISYLLLCNKLPQSLVAWNNNINYLTVSVRWESGCSLSGSSVSGSFTDPVQSLGAGWDCSPLQAQLRRDPLQAHLTIGRIQFLASSWPEAIPSSLPQGSLHQNKQAEKARESRRDGSHSLYHLIMEVTSHHSLPYSVMRSMYLAPPPDPPGERTAQGCEHQEVGAAGSRSRSCHYTALFFWPLSSWIPAGQLTLSCSQTSLRMRHVFIHSLTPLLCRHLQYLLCVNSFFLFKNNYL